MSQFLSRRSRSLEQVLIVMVRCEVVDLGAETTHNDWIRAAIIFVNTVDSD